jgi:hypothetical protein
MTNRIKGCHFRLMPLLSLASSGSALMRERMATVAHLLAAPTLVRLKAKLRHSVQGSPLEATQLLERRMSIEIADGHLHRTQMDVEEMANGGGAR